MEEKQYEYKGTVTISTEEYRDLIEGLASARAEASENNSARWRESREKDKVQAQLDDLTKKYNLYRDFIRNNPVISEQYSTWYAQQMNKLDSGV